MRLQLLWPNESTEFVAVVFFHDFIMYIEVHLSIHCHLLMRVRIMVTAGTQRRAHPPPASGGILGHYEEGICFIPLTRGGQMRGGCFKDLDLARARPDKAAWSQVSSPPGSTKVELRSSSGAPGGLELVTFFFSRRCAKCFYCRQNLHNFFF